MIEQKESPVERDLRSLREDATRLIALVDDYPNGGGTTSYICAVSDTVKNMQRVWFGNEKGT